MSKWGGEVWEEGKTYTIRWSSENLQGNVQIQLLWSMTGPGGLHTINNIPNTGSYNFTVPKLSDRAEIAPYLIISSMDGRARDASDNVFTIRGPLFSEMYNVYVGEHPKARKIDWSDEAQGIAHDKDHWYITQKGTLWKIPVSVDLSNARRTSPGVRAIDLRNVPQLQGQGYNHFGDLDYYEFKGQGYLLIPIEKGKAPPAIAAFDAATLGYINHATFGLPGAPWCAIDSQGVVYISNTGATVLRFMVYWETLRKDRKLNLGSLGSIFLQDESGKQVFIDTPQGGAISPMENSLYLVAGYSEGSHPSWGIHVFDLRTGRRIARSQNGFGPFNYEFHPGWSKYEEPEGMTIWDLDDGRAPGIVGKLHVLMLDNDADQDDIYLKHYTDKDAYPVLYEHANFGGKPLPLRTKGVYYLRNLATYGFNDIASSIWIPNGWTVEMYEHAEFKGASLRKTGPVSNLHPEGWGDRISSVSVFPPGR
ncbi:MAG: Ser-Thr-rich GPI-anchored membrane family protein [Thermodesulfobacteriota bacterium]